MFDENRKVWVPHLEHGFQLGSIIDIGVDGITIKPDSGGKVSDLYIDQGIFQGQRKGYLEVFVGGDLIKKTFLIHKFLSPLSHSGK